MTAMDFYTALKFWLPMVSAFGLVIGAYRSGKRGITEWADALLNNHLSHIQVATESTARFSENTAGLLVEIRNAGTAQATAVERVRMDLLKHEEEEAIVQRQIALDLAVLKDRL